jgi:hypothetical protein
VAPVVSCWTVLGRVETTVAVAAVSFGAGAALAAVASSGTRISAAAADRAERDIDNM